MKTRQYKDSARIVFYSMITAIVVIIITAITS